MSCEEGRVAWGGAGGRETERGRESACRGKSTRRDLTVPFQSDWEETARARTLGLRTIGSAPCRISCVGAQKSPIATVVATAPACRCDGRTAEEGGDGLAVCGHKNASF